MRNFFSKLILAAAMVLALQACSKNSDQSIPEEVRRTVRVSMVKGADSKVTLIEGADKASYIWTEGDDMYMKVFENGVEGVVEEIDFSSDMRTATLTVSFNTSQSSSYEYTARFAKEFSNHGNPKLSAIQYPTATSYDPSADVLLSQSIVKDIPAASLQFEMDRKITVNKMTLKGLEPGENITSVELSLDKLVAGTCSLTDGTFTGTDKKIVLNYMVSEVGQDGTFPVYFTCAPVSDATIQEVVVTTNTKKYVKPSSAFSRKLTLTLGKVSRFNMDMAGYGTPVASSNTFTLVEDLSGLTEGRYIIVASGYDCGVGALTGSYHSVASVVKSTDKKTIELDEASEVIVFDVAKSGSNWTFRNDVSSDSNYGKYLAYSGSSNSSTEQAGAYTWAVTVSGGEATIESTATSGRFLQYNSSSPRFACYQQKSNQKPVALYKSSSGGSSNPVGTDPVINVNATLLSVTSAGGLQCIGYTITNPIDGVYLNATANVPWIKNISVSSTEVTFYADPQEDGASSRSGVLTLDYDGAADVEVTVSQAAGAGGDQAVNGWLELPASTSGPDYFTGTFWAGSDRNYTYMYQYSTYTALWTAYPLYASTATKSSEEYVYPDVYSMAQSWNYNPQIDRDKQVNLKSSYGVSVLGTIYSRGHQIPNGDRKGNGTMQTQTYYYTNSTPQIQNGFNGTIWSALENGIRGQIGSDTTYVVTGASFRKTGGNEAITTINPAGDQSKNVPVPNYYWKVLLKVKRSGGTITSASAIGFWMEHKQYSGNDYSPYAVSVDQIEAWTGFDFFVNLPENLQTTAEQNTNWNTFKAF